MGLWPRGVPYRTMHSITITLITESSWALLTDFRSALQAPTEKKREGLFWNRQVPGVFKHIRVRQLWQQGGSSVCSSRDIWDIHWGYPLAFCSLLYFPRRCYEDTWPLQQQNPQPRANISSLPNALWSKCIFLCGWLQLEELSSVGANDHSLSILKPKQTPNHSQYLN